MYAQQTNASAEKQQHSTRPHPDVQQLYDVICVGFGTAGLALAMAMKDRNVNASVLFLESAPQFSASSEMGDNDEYMRINFMQDLATIRDPTSEFTFVNYLHEQEKLTGFMENAASSVFPLRKDFNSYLEWSAEHFNHCVAYGQETLDVESVKTSLPIKLWSVTANNGADTKIFAAKNVVFAKGGKATFTTLFSPPTEATKILEALYNSRNTPIEDEQISTLALSSMDLVSSLFDGKPSFMIHAML